MDQREEILDYFRILKKDSRLGTSYLFIGQDFSLVFDIIKLLSCPEPDGPCGRCWDCLKIDRRSHPDLHLVEPERFTIKIEAIREGIRFLSLKAFRLKLKFLVVDKGQFFGPEAANAFLKTLEEPPKNSFVAICASKLEGLLPTIVSRCRKIFLPSVREEIDTGSPLTIADFLQGKEVGFKDRQAFSSFLWDLIVLLRNNIIAKIAPGNNQLSRPDTCEIILGPYSVNQLQGVLKDILRIYSAASTVNMNLALNLIRMKL